ncbi:hypothetical protein [Actinoplanes sp. NPDC049316]|uniref:hypothetical protein n=1 Tax=Actinoplanes sp. NPDC049316 TaxID=3154727 RepID=UPI00341F4468
MQSLDGRAHAVAGLGIPGKSDRPQGQLVTSLAQQASTRQDLYRCAHDPHRRLSRQPFQYGSNLGEGGGGPLTAAVGQQCDADEKNFDVSHGELSSRDPGLASDARIMAIPPKDQERTTVGALYGMNPTTCGFCGSLHLGNGLTVSVTCAALSQQRQLKLR